MIRLSAVKHTNSPGSQRTRAVEVGLKWRLPDSTSTTTVQFGNLGHQLNLFQSWNVREAVEEL